MPASDPVAAGRAPSRESGMTLIEMLIVLAIIGVAAGAVTLGIGSASRAPTAESEARRLALRLQSAADDAMLGDRGIVFTAGEHGYGFAVLGSGAAPGDQLAHHTLPGGMVMRLSVRPPVLMGVDGTGQPMQATIDAGTQRWVVDYDGMTASARAVPVA